MVQKNFPFLEGFKFPEYELALNDLIKSRTIFSGGGYSGGGGGWNSGGGGGWNSGGGHGGGSSQIVKVIKVSVCPTNDFDIQYD